MIEGLILMALAIALAIAKPVGSHIDHRRNVRATVIGMSIAKAVPLAPVPLDLQQLVAAADAALERDELTRAVRAISDTYDRA